MHQHHKENIGYTKTTLYSVVFESWYVKSAVFSLFILLLIQPIAPALASLEEGDAPEPSFISPTFDTPEVIVNSPVPEEIKEAEVVSEDVSQSAGVGTEVTPEQTATIVAETETTIPLPVTQEPLPNSVEQTQNASTSDTEVSVLPPVVIDEEVITETEVQSSSTLPSATTSPSTELEEVVEEVIQSEESTTTVASIVATSTDAVFGRPAKAFEFDTKECASVGDGAYYCSTPKDLVDPLQDGVFALPDNDGDLEIFVRVGGSENKLTDNKVDDSAPYFDAVSKRIVWHTSIDDRYQIISYDTETTEKTLITKTSYNNMEPVASGNVTLWQAWIGNNWEIMMYDNEAVVQLTNNTQQDVSPHMREGYIVWQTQFTDGWKVAVYDQKTKTIEYINSEGGLKVENPRFVLVYDSTNEQGDIQTVGYDLNNKQSFTLGSLPAQLPEQLPEPDQTGETRALIQNKQSSKEGDTEVIDIPLPSSGNTTSTATSSVSSLDLSVGTTSQTSATSSPTVISDVLIPSYTATSTESQDVITIPDLVIPPNSATTTEEIS